jgi:hypothetical protein
MRRAVEMWHIGGEAALQEVSLHRPLLWNRVDPQIKAAVVELALELPANHQMRIASKVRE